MVSCQILEGAHQRKSRARNVVGIVSPLYRYSMVLESRSALPSRSLCYFLPLSYDSYQVHAGRQYVNYYIKLVIFKLGSTSSHASIIHHTIPRKNYYMATRMG